VAIDKEILAPSSYRKSVVVPMPGPSDALNKPKASTSNVYAQKVVVKQAGRVSFPVSHNALTLHSQHSCRYTTCPPEQHYQARKFVLRIRSGCMSQDLHGLSCPWSWAARFNTWLLIKLTPKGVVYSFLFSCPCFGATCRVTWPIPCKTCKSRGCCNQTPQGSLTLPHPTTPKSASTTGQLLTKAGAAATAAAHRATATAAATTGGPIRPMALAASTAQSPSTTSV